MEWLATDAYFDNLYRRIRHAYDEGYRGIVEREQALKAAREAANAQMKDRTG